MDERTLQTMAHFLIKLHQDAAVSLIRQCIDDAVECGDEYGFIFWNGVLHATEAWERQRQKPAN